MLLQHQAFNWIEADRFEDALEASKLALEGANRLFAITSHITSPPPTNSRGRVTPGAFRQWTCQRIKEGAELHEQRIKCEEIGRCYYYKNIAEHALFGEKIIDEDKLMGIGCCVCCVVSDTVTKEDNLPNELVELDSRTMERLKARNRGSEDEEDDWVDEGGWEDDEDKTEESEGWEDEEEDVVDEAEKCLPYLFEGVMPWPVSGFEDGWDL